MEKNLYTFITEDYKKAYIRKQYAIDFFSDMYEDDLNRHGRYRRIDHSKSRTAERLPGLNKGELMEHLYCLPEPSIMSKENCEKIHNIMAESIRTI